MRMINKILLSLIAVLCLDATVTAQNKQVSGTVTDPAGAPVVGATVLVEGTTIGSTTDASGHFSLNAPEDAKLNISFIGYESQQVDVAGRTHIPVSLKEDSHTIDDVVVTAMGITRSEKTLGYSVSTVKSDELTKARDGNILNALSGKVAGVNISSSSGTAGGSSRIIIRGQSSLGSSGQPLFVIDGMPVSNQSYDPGNAGSALSGAAVDPGNRMGDIASDDIESINVLKGAAATALYGARAKDGAVIITTKKGSKNQQTSVSINSTMRFESVLRLPDFQNSYAQGVPTTGAYSYGYQNGWGPKIEGQTVKNFLGQDVQLRAYKNNVKDFYQTGHTYINSVAVSGGDDKNDFRLGLTAHNQTGVIPNNEYDKYNVSFNGGRKFNDKLEARISFSYAHTTSQGRPAQGSNDVNVLVNQINAIPRTTDINWLKNNWYAQDGTTVTQASVDEAGKTGNLYWTVNKNKNTGTVDRMFGSAVISYKPVKGLTITNNLGTDFFEEQRRQIYAWGTVGLPDGQFNTNNITYRQINNDLMISYDTTFGKDWSFKAMLGHNINQNFTKYLDVTAKNLLVADIYSYANAESVITTNDQAKSRLIGVYGEIDLGYKDIVYLSVTGRNDWSSTMPKSHRSYFYPSVSAGFVFSQLIPQNDVLSFGKLRLSYANVGSDTVPYALDFLYTPESSIFLQYVGNNSIPHGGLLAYMAPATYPDPNLEPQNQSSFEIGTDLRFFNGRIRLDATYYYNKTTKNIVRLDVANSTGFFYAQERRHDHQRGRRDHGGLHTGRDQKFQLGSGRELRVEPPAGQETRSFDHELHPLGRFQLAPNQGCGGRTVQPLRNLLDDRRRGQLHHQGRRYARRQRDDEKPRQGGARLDDGHQQHAALPESVAELPDRRPLRRRHVLGYRFRPARERHGRGDDRKEPHGHRGQGRQTGRHREYDGHHALPVLVEQLQLESVRGQRLRRHLRQTARNGAQLPDAAALVQELLHRFAGTGRRGPQPVAHEVERAAHRSRNQHLRPVGRRFGRRILGDSHDPKLGFQHQINLLNKQDV